MDAWKGKKIINTSLVNSIMDIDFLLITKLYSYGQK
jgi:hypothetical protein